MKLNTRTLRALCSSISVGTTEIGIPVTQENIPLIVDIDSGVQEEFRLDLDVIETAWFQPEDIQKYLNYLAFNGEVESDAQAIRIKQLESQVLELEATLGMYEADLKSSLSLT